MWRTQPLSYLLFFIVVEAIYGKIRSGCLEELLYADDLALVSESLEGLKGRLEAWKENWSENGLE